MQSAEFEQVGLGIQLGGSTLEELPGELKRANIRKARLTTTKTKSQCVYLQFSLILTKTHLPIRCMIHFGGVRPRGPEAEQRTAHIL